MIQVKSQFSGGDNCPLTRPLGGRITRSLDKRKEVCFSKIKRTKGKTQNWRKYSQYVHLPEDLDSDYIKNCNS